ncbi:hypothetical protein GS429_14335 [Natronorubrum sp. JWXQ-INN-674]|uniref:DUF7344 domain-containing protein n=1 Tax=Natronorubrum halalkaliphilum TaxID=2691917 RepID=A0A6B0VNZ1_9EURY|nr:hypothetical protein [Natronorubrum halalkaliphilum]MXV63224.1 hypothetical protein [Natronorubrum halalkaliphilum]
MTTKNQRTIGDDSSLDSGRRVPDDRPSVETLLEVLVDPGRRQILETLRGGTDGQFIDSLLEPRGEPGRDEQPQRRSELRAALYHQQLPKLEDVGLVEIDWDRKLIYYRPDARVERLLDTVSSVATEWEPVEQPRPTTRSRDVVDSVRRLVRSLGRNR